MKLKDNLKQKKILKKVIKIIRNVTFVQILRNRKSSGWVEVKAVLLWIA